MTVFSNLFRISLLGHALLFAVACTDANPTSSSIFSSSSTEFEPVSGIVFAATSNGLSISYNGGKSFRTKTTENGLASDTVNRVFVDYNGAIWVATNNGVSFSNDDADTFQSGLPNINVNDIYPNAEQYVMAGTSSGLYLSNSGLSGFTLVPNGALPGPVLRVAYNHDDNVAYALTPMGLYRNSSNFSVGAWVLINGNNGFSYHDMILEHHDGDPLVFLATNVGALYSLDGGDSWYKYDSFSNPELGSNDIYSVGMAHDDQVYIGKNDGLYYSNNAGDTFVRILGTDDDPISIENVYVDNKDNVYVSTQNGLYIQSKTSGLFFLRTSGSGLGSSSVRNAQVYLPSAIYALTAKGPAVSKDGGRNFTSAVGNLPQSGTMKSLFVDHISGEIYVGSSSGLYRSTNGGRTYSTMLSETNVNDIYVSDIGDVYVATTSGLFRYDNQFITSTQIIPYGTNSIHKSESNVNEIFVGTTNGVYYTEDGATWENVSTASVIGLPGSENDVLDVMRGESSNNVYLVQRDSFYAYGQPNSFWTQVFTGPTSLSQIYEIMGMTWLVEPGNGIWGTMDYGNTFPLHFTTSTNLPSNNVNKIAFQKWGGAMVAATDAGVSIIRLNSNTSPVTRTAGLPDLQVVDITTADPYAGDGTVIVGLNTGMAYAENNARTKFHNFNIGAPVNSILFEDDDRMPVFMGTTGAGLYITEDGVGFVNVTSGLASDTVLSMVYDPYSDSIFFGTTNGISWTSDFDPDDGIDIFSSGDLAGLVIYDLESDPMTGFVYAATSAGLFYFDGSMWVDYFNGGLTEGIKSIEISYAPQYPLGAIAMGLEFGGVLYSSDGGNTWSNSILGYYVNEMYSDESGAFYVATDKALFVAKNIGDGFDRMLTTADGLPSSHIKDVAVNKYGQIYLATAKGLAISYDRGRTWVIKNSQVNLTNGEIRAVSVRIHN